MYIFCLVHASCVGSAMLAEIPKPEHRNTTLIPANTHCRAFPWRTVLVANVSWGLTITQLKPKLSKAKDIELRVSLYYHSYTDTR